MLRIFVVVALTFGAAAVTLLSLLVDIGGVPLSSGLPAATLGFILALVFAVLLARGGWIRAGALVMLIAGFLSSTLLGLFGSHGVMTSAFSFYSLLVLAAGVLLGVRAAWVVGLVCAVALCVAHGAESVGSFADPAQASRPPTALRAGLQLVLLGASVTLATMFSRVLSASLEAAREQEQRFRRLLGISAECYWEQDREHRFTRFTSTIDGADRGMRSGLIGRTGWEIHDSGLTPEQLEAHRADLAARRPFRDLIVGRLDEGGRRCFISISGEPNFGPDGEFRGYWGVARDVTAAQNARAAIEDNERRYRVLFDRSPLAKVIHRRGVVLLANEAAAQLFGAGGPNEMVGTQLLRALADADKERVAAHVADPSVMQEGEMLPPAELRIRRADGDSRLVQARSVRVPLTTGAASLSLFVDITERKQAEAALRRSEEMLSRLFAASPDAIVIGELTTSRLVMVNDRYLSMFGYSREELIGRSSLELGIWADPAQRRKVLEVIERDGVVHGFPATRRTRDGRVLSVHYSATRVQLDGVDYLIATIGDVTEQDRERLQQQAILANASVGIAFTRDRVFQLVNPHFEEMFGWASGTLAGMPGAVVWRSTEAYAEIGRTLGPRLARGEQVVEDFQMRRRDGSLFWCRVRARSIDVENPVSGGTIWIAQDVTHERAAAEEIAAARQAAETANRAKSVFLANTSHEIRTPLNGLLGLAQLALRPGVDADTLRRYLRQIRDCGETLQAILSDLLDLSKIEAGKLALERVGFDLRDLLDSLAAGHRELAQQKGLALTQHASADVPSYVEGDPTRIRQVLSNFMSNAVKFTLNGEVRLGAAMAGGLVRLSVADTGIGIDRATQARLFVPFMQADDSTTRRFGGTGLGLAICRQLAELMGGRVGVDSTPGAGSTFWIELSLPAATRPADRPARHGTGEMLRGKRVLVAEDNDINQLIAQTLLKQWGADVTTVDDGSQAVAAVEAAAGGFDAVLMDLHMPVMNGVDATASLRRRYSADQLPILALTAAALGPERDQCLAAGMNDFIVKPFEVDSLLAALTRWTGVP